MGNVCHNVYHNLQEAKVIKETLTSQLDENKCLEAKMTTQIKEAEKR
jgi:hypothetical protein